MTLEAYAALREKGYAIAGELGDLNRRADVYHRMYLDSGKRSVFPLIAAHGALWATGYFKLGRLGGMLLSLPYLLTPALRRARLASTAAFADKFMDINRRVCAESYAIYHYTKRYGGSSFIRTVIGDDFADILCECHASNRAGTPYPQAVREKLFYAFFAWEQAHIVGPAVTEAFDNFDWPLVKYLAMRTKLDFTYFGNHVSVRFKDFSSREERISRGLLVYRHAEEVGLDHVEHTLNLYKFIPDASDANVALDLRTRMNTPA
jgi:hypothetical protein